LERKRPKGRVLAQADRRQVAGIRADERIIVAEIVKKADAPLENVAGRCRGIHHRQICRDVARPGRALRAGGPLKPLRASRSLRSGHPRWTLRAGGSLRSGRP
jgi:hypothetical protein